MILVEERMLVDHEFGCARLLITLALSGALAAGCDSHASRPDAGLADSSADASPDAPGANIHCPESCPDRCFEGRCVQCLEHQQCYSGQCQGTHECARSAHCSTSDTCPSIRPICRASFCVECLIDDDCADSSVGPFCNPRGNICTACAHGIDCPSGACRPDGMCAGAECARACAAGEHVGLSGRCVATHDCSGDCPEGQGCDGASGTCRLASYACSYACEDGEICNEFGLCVPECACPEGQVWYATRAACGEPASCPPPLSPLSGDPTRCRYPNCDSPSCAVTDVCVDGGCRPSSCGAEAPPFTCHMDGPFVQSPNGSADRRVPSVRIAVLGPGANTSRVAIHDEMVFWIGDSGTLEGARARIGKRYDTTDDCYTLRSGGVLMDCDEPTHPALPFSPTDFALPRNGTRLGAVAPADSTTGVTGFWRVDRAEDGLCGALMALGRTPSDSLIGHVAMSTAYPDAHPPVFGLQGDAVSTAYPRAWSQAARVDMKAAEWASAFRDASDVSAPSTRLGAGDNLGVYATEDGRLLAWNGRLGSAPFLVPGVDHVVGNPMLTGPLLVATRQEGATTEIVTTPCAVSPPGTGLWSCGDVAHSPIGSLPVNPSVAMAVWGFSTLWIATEEETEIDGEVRIGLHVLDSAGTTAPTSMVVFDSASARAPIRNILALDAQVIGDDIAWAAIATIERDGTLRTELWSGGWRVCEVYLGP